jgi:hypothetical protein
LAAAVAGAILGLHYHKYASTHPKP